MTEEPYRWLEAVGNRREYVREQLKGGSPVFAASLPEGILLLGIGSGQSKVFELFDRHALAGLGHPADIEKIRMAAIDAAHTEAFTRAPEDVSLRRLVSFGLSPLLKTSFEQIVSAPFLVEALLAEISGTPDPDLFVRLHFDGSFETQKGGICIVSSHPEREAAAMEWLKSATAGKTGRGEIAEILLQAWWVFQNQKSFATLPDEADRQAGWSAALGDKMVEVGWLARKATRPARFETLNRAQLGL